MILQNIDFSLFWDIIVNYFLLIFKDGSFRLKNYFYCRSGFSGCLETDFYKVIMQLQLKLKPVLSRRNLSTRIDASVFVQCPRRRKSFNFDHFDNSRNSFLWPEYFIDFYVKNGSHVRLRHPSCVYIIAHRPYTAVQKYISGITLDLYKIAKNPLHKLFSAPSTINNNVLHLFCFVPATKLQYLFIYFF